MTKKQSPYLPPYKPRPTRSAYDPPALTPTKALAPDVVPPSPPPKAQIDLDDLEERLLSARPSERLPILGRFLRNSRLRSASTELELHTKVFQDLSTFYEANAKATADREIIDEGLHRAIQKARTTLTMADKMREVELARLDADLAEAKRRKKMAEDDDNY